MRVVVRDATGFTTHTIHKVQAISVDHHPLCEGQLVLFTSFNSEDGVIRIPAGEWNSLTVWKDCNWEKAKAKVLPFEGKVEVAA